MGQQIPLSMHTRRKRGTSPQPWDTSHFFQSDEVTYIMESSNHTKNPIHGLNLIRVYQQSWGWDQLYLFHMTTSRRDEEVDTST